MTEYFEHLPVTAWFEKEYKSAQHSKFPSNGKTDYLQILRSTHGYLNSHVHPTIGQRSTLSEANLFLTDHGPDHIKTVIKRAQYLIASKAWDPRENREMKQYDPCLEPYEVFLLIMAIHFHDVGNMYGREGHEKRIGEEMARIGALHPLDKFEQGLIASIATCHGGTIDQDKNVIAMLPAKGAFGDISYRPQLIAAVLRLADELAEERSRADSYALLNPTALPPSCAIFHKFASALSSVIIDSQGEQICLKFQLTREDAHTAYPFKGASVYLLDYIYERALKTYREMTYCSRFMRGLDCHFHQVAIEIEAFCEARDFQPAQTIAFRIGDTGYPDDNQGTLENLAQGFPREMTGEFLAEALNKKCLAISHE